MAEELKCCPFCGGQPQRVSELTCGPIFCLGCGAMANIKDWNRRAPAEVAKPVRIRDRKIIPDSEDPGACPGCGSLNACQGECSERCAKSPEHAGWLNCPDHKPRISGGEKAKGGAEPGRSYSVKEQIRNERREDGI